MKQALLDDTWKRRGISVLWDAPSLYAYCRAEQVVSLRTFRQLHQTGWPEADMPLVNDDTLVVAGLDVAIDTLSPEEAETWLEAHIYPAVRSYQDDFAGGGSGAALVFWMADIKRWIAKPDGTYHWHCGGNFKGETIPLGRCLWNGVELELRKIEVNKRWAGLYQVRIS